MQEDTCMLYDDYPTIRSLWKKVPKPERAWFVSFLTSQVHLANGEPDENSEHQESEPTALLFAITYLLFGIDIIWVIIVTDKLFCKSMNTSVDKAAGGKGIAKPGICVFVSNN